jgi:hypothetical protein
VVRVTRQYRHSLLGKPFTLQTDHSSLAWLLRFESPQGQLARCMEELCQYSMVKHRSDVKHAHADVVNVMLKPGPECYPVVVVITV